MNAHVSERWEPFVRSQVQSGRYASEAEVIEEALRLLKERDCQAQDDKARVETLLIQGLDSGPSTPMTSQDWDEIEREGQRLIAARKARKAQ